MRTNKLIVSYNGIIFLIQKSPFLDMSNKYLFRDGALKRLFFALEYRILKASAYIFNEKHQNIKKLQHFLIKIFLLETYSGKDLFCKRRRLVC